jgi:hypothetical protein
MDPRIAATRVPDPDAVEFIRFCYRRRRVGWPELYDEMCAVAGRGTFRGYGADDLAAFGIGFSLFDMPALAALANSIVAEELALRRPVTVTIMPMPTIADEADVEAHSALTLVEPMAAEVPPPVEPKAAEAPPPRIRFSPVTAGV